MKKNPHFISPAILTVVVLLMGMVLVSYQGKAQANVNRKELSPGQKTKMKDDLQKLSPDQRAKFLTDTMNVWLPLQTGQYSSIYSINLKYARLTEPILKSTDTKITKFYKINAMQGDKEAEYKKVLTDPQFKKYMELKDSLMKKARSKM